MSANAVLSERDLAILREAKSRLESPGFFVKITRRVGEKIHEGVLTLSIETQKKIAETTRAALEWAMNTTFGTLNHAIRPAPSIWSHRLMVAGTGAVGGAIGLISLPVELPITTGIMFRSIADIARAEGEDLNSPETRMACLTVFGLSPDLQASEEQMADAELESGYYAMIFAFSKAIVEGVEHSAQRVLVGGSSGAISRLLVSVGERFGITVSERMMLMAAPAVGALGGVVINSLFMLEFQELALGHFAVRRLERQYGQDAVRAAYEAIVL